MTTAKFIENKRYTPQYPFLTCRVGIHETLPSCHYTRYFYSPMIILGCHHHFLVATHSGLLSNTSVPVFTFGARHISWLSANCGMSQNCVARRNSCVNFSSQSVSTPLLDKHLQHQCQDDDTPTLIEYGTIGCVVAIEMKWCVHSGGGGERFVREKHSIGRFCQSITRRNKFLPWR